MWRCSMSSPRPVERSETVRRPPLARIDAELPVADGFDLDLVGRRLRHDGRAVHLRPREFDLLATLARNPGRAFTRASAGRPRLGPAGDIGPRTVDVHVHWLRAKIEPAAPADAPGHRPGLRLSPRSAGRVNEPLTLGESPLTVGPTVAMSQRRDCPETGPRAQTHGHQEDRNVSISTTKRVGALALIAAVALGACSSGGASSAPSAAASAAPTSAARPARAAPPQRGRPQRHASSSTARARSSRSRRPSPRNSEPPTPASTSPSRSPGPAAGSRSSAPARPTSTTRRGRSRRTTPRKAPPARPTASPTSSSRSRSTA